MLEQYPRDVKLVYKDIPIPNHRFGRPAARAALAAGEQHQFWEYHDKVMQNASQLSPQMFLDFAQELGLDMDAFQKSLEDPKHERHIDKDRQDAVSAGITRTPTIFVNGHIVTIRSLEAIKAMVNDEIQKKRK